SSAAVPWEGVIPGDCSEGRGSAIERCTTDSFPSADAPAGNDTRVSLVPTSSPLQVGHDVETVEASLTRRLVSVPRGPHHAALQDGAHLRHVELLRHMPERA